MDLFVWDILHSELLNAIWGPSDQAKYRIVIISFTQRYFINHSVAFCTSYLWEKMSMNTCTSVLNTQK